MNSEQELISYAQQVMEITRNNLKRCHVVVILLSEDALVSASTISDEGLQKLLCGMVGQMEREETHEH